MKSLSSITISMLILMLIFPGVTEAQEEEDSYTMYETALLTPKSGHLKTLQENMKAHNEKFHNQDPYRAHVWNITTGPNVGKMLWVMGPATYTELDNRPDDAAHNNDWRDNVVPYLHEEATVEYWKRNDELSKDGPEGQDYPMVYARFWKVDIEHEVLIGELLKQISETVKEMDEASAWDIWGNEFIQGDIGRHILFTSPLKGWGDLDQDFNFMETFKEVHGGDQAWNAFQHKMGLAVEDIFDEIWIYNSELSVPAEE